MHFKTVIPFLLSQVAALGCYNGGLAFNDLHGGRGTQDLDQEVMNDINTVCNIVAGKTFKKGDPPFTHCSEWKVTVEPDDTCYENCEAGCEATGSNPANRAGDLSAGLCGSQCDPDCGGPRVGTMSHISWEIKHNNDDAETVMSFDACNKAFLTELGGCSTGSEQNHDGFFYKIDPNAGTC